MTMRSFGTPSCRGLLSTEEHLQRVFRADEEVREAQGALAAARARAQADDAAGAAVRVAARWLQRVEVWRQNLRAALAEDSVAVPGQGGRRLLLYVPPPASEMWSPRQCRGLMCRLCRKCRGDLPRADPPRLSAPGARMPFLARANGLWGGPEPRDIAVRSYVERKTVQLVRRYIP